MSRETLSEAEARPVALDPAKLLGFRIASSDESKIGIKLGTDKIGLSKSQSD